MQEEDNSTEIELRDATVKLLRLLANLTIDGTIGKHPLEYTFPIPPMLPIPPINPIPSIPTIPTNPYHI